MKVLLLIYPIALLGITLWQGKIAKSGDFNEDIWNRNQAKMLQAFACIGVIFHHVTQLITSYGQVNKGPITIMSSMGILFTSIFFFFSGYGLITSVNNKPGYLDDFLIHRLSTILVPFFVSNTIYVLVRINYDHIPTSGVDVIRIILGLVLLNGNGWYIVEILILYLMFYCFFRVIRNRTIATILLCLSAAAIILIGYGSGHDYSDIGDKWFKGEWWYNSTIVFIMGVLVAQYKERIIDFAKNHYRALIIITSVAFVIFFYVEEKVLARYGYYRESIAIDRVNSQLVSLIAQMLVCVIFTWMILLISMKLSLGNKVIRFISLISTELFLIHGLFISHIFDLSRVNDFAKYALVLGSGIAGAFIVNRIDTGILYMLSKLKKDKSYLDECEIDLIRESHVRRKKLVLKIALTVVFVVLAGIGVYKLYVQVILLPRDCEEEARNIAMASIGDEIIFGRYDTSFASAGKERLCWIVLDKTDDGIMLITKEGITGSVYYQEHQEVKWDDSDLCKLLNSEMYHSMFSENEKKLIVPNPDSGDMLSLLSVKEADRLFQDDISRQLDVTEIALNEGTNINSKSKANKWDIKGYRSSWWWLRGENSDILAPIVTVDGEIVIDKKPVNKPYGAVRPVVWVKVKEE